MTTGAVVELAERVLRSNWTEGQRDGVPYAYTAPSPGRYPWQWYWDSCFAAIVWKRFDPERARRELESLLAARREDGFIGHTIFWGGPPDRLRSHWYGVVKRSDPTTSTIQPPLLAWAWSLAVGDPKGVPGIAEHMDWLARERTLDGGGPLLWIISPDESGLDASPKFDPVWGRRAHGRLGFWSLAARNRALGFELGAVLDAGGPVVCETVVNVLYGLSLLAMGRESITPVMVDRMWDPEAGLFRDIARGAGGAEAPVPMVQTWAALAPLALPDLPEAIGRRMVEEHLLDPDRFWLPLPPPSVAASEASFSPRETWPLRRYWRGPTWVNAAWLLWQGMRRLGYEAEAAEMAARLCGAVEREGLREYYDPFTGRGLGARDFAWSALAVEMEAGTALA